MSHQKEISRIYDTLGSCCLIDRVRSSSYTNLARPRKGQILPFEAPKAVRARANLDDFLSASLPYKHLQFHHRSSTSNPSSLRLVRSCHLCVCSSLICCVRWTRSVEVRLANLGHGEAISRHLRTRWLTSTGQQYLQSQPWPRWGQQR